MLLYYCHFVLGSVSFSLSLTDNCIKRLAMASNQVLLFLIVGKNEPLYEAEIHKRGGTGNSDAVARQNYFVVHSALDLVEKASWTTQNVSFHRILVPSEGRHTN